MDQLIRFPTWSGQMDVGTVVQDHSALHRSTVKTACRQSQPFLQRGANGRAGQANAEPSGRHAGTSRLPLRSKPPHQCA